MNHPKLENLADVFYEFAPAQLAEDWDPIGLHFGHMQKPIKKVMVTLDVRPATVKEAIDRGADLIFAHHPPIFSKISSFDLSDPQMAMYAEIIKHDISVFAAHTNLDRAKEGMNQWLAEALDLKEIEVMEAYTETDATGVGYGRVGNLSAAQDVESFLAFVKDHLNLDGLRYVLPKETPHIERVAIMGGSGSSYYTSALEKGADAYITGDVSYHDAHDIQEAGLVLVDAGHHIESICIQHLFNLFEEWEKEYNWDIEVIASEMDTNPFQFYV